MQRTLGMPENAPHEKRRAIRRRFVLGAKIIYNGRTCVVDCQISNISETGCKLMIHGSAHIPTQFTLNFNASKEVRECEVAWWDERTAGVRFLN